jgi:hypothetical protein
VYQLDFETFHTYGTQKRSIEVDVTLRFGERTVSFPAQIETGATFCVFERGYAEALGLAVDSGEPIRFSTAIGSFDGYGHSVTVEALGYAFDVLVYFAAEESFKRNVLGRRGWLDHVRIALVDYKGELYLSEFQD